MARPREITDERLITAAGVAISRLGPAFTLADVAGEARVAVGTLAQRFGSKHGLLVAMARGAIEAMRSDFGVPVADASDPGADGSGPGAGAGADGSDSVAALVTAYAPLDDSVTAANNLAQLAFDLADEELRGLMAEFYAVMEAQVAALLSRAVLAGGLPGAPSVPVAARILTAVADGTAIHWSARPIGGLCDRMRADLDAVVAGWRHPPLG